MAPNEVGTTAAIVDAPGSEPHIGLFPLPTRAAGSTLLGVIAAPLNPLDLLIASGGFHSARHEEPYVPGSECVGRVLESDRYPVGSLVYAEAHASPSTPGTLATRTVVLDDDVLPLRHDVDPVEAAAIGNAGTAAYLPLVELTRVRPGDTVLVLGATGSVGRLAVQIARAHGAARIVGVGRHSKSLDRLQELGADAAVELRADETADELAARILADGGEADVVFDTVFGMPFEAALRSCARRARIVNVGNGAGPVVQLPAGLLRGKQLTISGFAGLHTPLREKAAALEWLWTALAAHEVEVDVHTFPLEELPDAWRAQAGSPHAKYVALPNGLVGEASVSERRGSTALPGQSGE